MKKGQTYEGKVIRVDYPNKGLILVGEDNVIVKNTIPGQKVSFTIKKKRKGKAEGRLNEVLEKSSDETRDNACSIFGSCGGCNYHTLSYDKQLKMKNEQVKKLLDKACNEYEYEGILRSPSEWEYRNKMEYSFGDEYKEGPLSLGFHKRGSFHDILTAYDCVIIDSDFNKILTCVLKYCRERKLSYYHKLTHKGYLRHLLVRKASNTGEILICIVTTSQEDMQIEELTLLTKQLLNLQLKGTISGIIHANNDGLADVVKSDEMILLYGRDYIYEKLLGLTFKISVFSFFQTNSKGAEVLYSKVREYVGETKDKNIFDLYSGTGTIAQLLAAVANKVTGVEIVEEAVEAAKENAALNKLTNCEFIAGDVLKVADELKDNPDIIVLDPPRDGINPKALIKIIDYGVDRIIYVSCKPTSLIRDLEVFQENGYKVEKACAVDMFPQTVHVETVVLMSRNK